MAAIYISCRYSEASGKAQLLGDALRKRGANSTYLDPHARWDRQRDSGAVIRHLNDADLVVVLATKGYGRALRGRFGSKEELELMKKMEKHYMLIKVP